MRSENVFAAGKKIGNRFLLCRVTSVAARRLQKGQKPFTESINESLKLVALMSPRDERGSATGELRISPDHISVHSGPIFDPWPQPSSTLRLKSR
jgi:hypothetical protein